MNWKTFTFLTCIFFCVALKAFSQSSQPLLINNGSKYSINKERKVELRIAMTKAIQMMISNQEDFSGGIWEDYSTFRQWMLEDSDGLKSVYIKFKDQGGKESPVFKSAILLDRVPPNPLKFAINNDSRFCINKAGQVRIILKAEDASMMSVSNDSLFSGEKWVNYSDSLSWLLGGSDGNKKVFARFKDKAGNISETIKDDIILDRTPPSETSLRINDGASLTHNEKVKLTLKATGAAEVMLKEPNAKWRTFEPVITDFALTGEDGIKVITARFRDEAGNLSQPVNAQIKLDRKPPHEGRIQLDNGAKFTSHPQKKVNLRAFALEATEIVVSEDSTFQDAKWENYKTNFSVTLSGDDGKKVVYAKFRDIAGNETGIVKDEILLDRSASQENAIVINEGNGITSTPVVKINLKASEATQMMVSSSETFLGILWEKYQQEKAFNLQGGDGEKFIYAKFKDPAGNISPIVSASITLDRKPPEVTSFKIDNGAAFTTNKEGKITLNFLATDAWEMMISNVNDFKGAIWENFQQIKEWQLTGADGLKVVGAKFKDKAGNVSNVVTAKIKLAKSASVAGKFSINGDSLVTKNSYKKVDLSITSEGAKEMIISNFADFRDGVWEEANPNKVWTLEGEDGEKTVYLKLKGFVGNESKVYSDKIVLDRTPPVDCKISIIYDSTKKSLASNLVKLKISASSAVKMMVSNNPVFQGAQWEDFKDVKPWMLDKEDGVKQVYAKFRDEIGNESEVVTAKILLDKTPPENVGLKINNGAVFTCNKNKAVTLVFQANGANFLRVSNLPDMGGEKWEKMSNKKLNWILPGEDGEHAVYVQYKDEGDNLSSVVSDKIVLDRKPPANCSFQINNDSLYTRSSTKDVRLSLIGSEVNSVLISNRPDFFGARWENFKRHKNHWILDGEDGEKIIYMLFKDEAGNIFPDTIKKKIILDRTPPADVSIQVNGGNSTISNSTKKISLSFKADGARYFEIRRRKEIPGEWEDFKEIKEWGLEGGEKELWIRLKDEAGNTTDFIPVEIKSEAL